VVQAVVAEFLRLSAGLWCEKQSLWRFPAQMGVGSVSAGKGYIVGKEAPSGFSAGM